MNKVVNIVMKALLIVAAVALAWMSYRSIMTPIEFNEIKDQRESVVIERLKDIRIVENEYRKITGDYTDNIDTLLHWLKTADAEFIIKEGELTDKQLEEGMTEAKMWEMEKAKKAADSSYVMTFVRDTTTKPMVEALFQRLDYPVDSLRYIPFSSPRKTFKLQKAEIFTNHSIPVKVMCAQAPYEDFLGDLDKQQLVNLIASYENDEETQKTSGQKYKKFPGVQFGDINKPNNNAGNWE
jgi:hypothetical protein